MGTLLVFKDADFSVNAVKVIDPDTPGEVWNTLNLGTPNKGTGFISSGSGKVSQDAYWGNIFAYTNLIDIPTGALQIRADINCLILSDDSTKNSLPIVAFYNASETYISQIVQLTTVSKTISHASYSSKNVVKSGSILVDIPANAAKMRVQWVYGDGDSATGSMSEIKIDIPTVEYKVQ